MLLLQFTQSHPLNPFSNPLSIAEKLLKFNQESAIKENNTTNQVFALLAMLALFIAGYFADQWFVRIRNHAAASLALAPDWWVIPAIGFLTVLLAMSLALWVIAGSARGAMIHWLFLVIGLAVTLYAPVAALAFMNDLLPANLQIPLLSGDNMLATARILTVAGLLGLLWKPRRSAQTD